MNKQEIKGNIFIIPNMLSNFCDSEFHVEHFNRSIKPNIEKVIGRSVEPNEVYVEVWCYTPEDNNSN